MILTAKQQEGLRIAIQRFKDKEPYTCIAGYAGTGKSTLVSHIISALGIPPICVGYIAFTGKAASVLQHKGCEGAMTAHKLLYYANKTSSGRFVFKPRTSLEFPYRLLVVDEVSMLPAEMWQLLLRHRVHVLALGDPFQLPPVRDKDDNHVLDHPHIFLDEIMRQAADSEIIQLSMTIREQRPIQFYKGKDIQVIRQSDLVSGMYTWADQILVGTNGTRAAVNQAVRSMLGKGPVPEEGDKVICLNNEWDTIDVTGSTSLVNGTTGFLKDIKYEDMRFKSLRGQPKFPIMRASMQTIDGEIFDDLIIDQKAMLTGDKTLTPAQEYTVHKRGVDPLPVEFNYGYAITTHKAQGSQWNNILVFEEGFPYNKVEHARWLYTAVTRAASKLILVRA